MVQLHVSTYTSAASYREIQNVTYTYIICIYAVVTLLPRNVKSFRI